jgi:hypothetical protein
MGAWKYQIYFFFAHPCIILYLFLISFRHIPHQIAKSHKTQNQWKFKFLIQLQDYIACGPIQFVYSYTQQWLCGFQSTSSSSLNQSLISSFAVSTESLPWIIFLKKKKHPLSDINIINNSSPKWKWILALFTDTEMNNCFSISMYNNKTKTE